MLQAIEEEKFDQLPGGVFNKGFIRAYARHVGLNDEEAVNEYLACLRQAQIDAQAVWEPSGPGKRPQVAAHQIAANQAVAGKVTRRQSESGTEGASATEELPGLQLPRLEHLRAPRRKFANRRNRLPWRPVVIVLLLLVAAGVLWQRRTRHARAEGEAATSAPLQQASQPVPVSASGTLLAEPNHASSSQTHNATTGKGVVAADHSGSAANSGSATNTKPTNVEHASEEDDNASKPDVSPAPVSKTPARFQLVIHADENSWISVTADGQPVSHETLIAPADTSIRANREIVARIGNAAGVSFVWNGQEIQPQGGEAEVKTFVFDENGMHEAPAPQITSPSH